MAAYQGTVRRVARDFPNLSLIGTQWRGAKSADAIDWDVVLFEPAADNFYTAVLRTDIPILEQTAGGDSFLSGVLAAFFKEKNMQTVVEWGAAHEIRVQESPGDILSITETQLLAEIKHAKIGGGVKASR